MILISEIVTSALLATSAMTAFSYIFSYILNGNFKEPQLLNYLIANFPSNNLTICREHIYGWFIHFLIGGLFVIIFKIISAFYAVNLSFLTGAVFGIVAGLIGIGGWAIGFSLHPKPPSINKALFYLQLIFAHLVFGIVMVSVLDFF